MFFVSFLFVTFYYTVYMYETDPYRYVFYELYFDKNTLPLSSGLSLLSISGYIFGAVLVNTKKRSSSSLKTIDFTTFKSINTTPLFLLSLFFLLLYVLTGGYEQIMMQYIGGGVDVVQEGAISQYFFAIFPAFMLSGIIGEAINLKIHNNKSIVFLKINKVAYICVGLIFLCFS
ncbi:hypothetical protein JJC03_00575 [Flavobacterium oreochromis]|uniref:hypothetical protein n=1 Tax=Flavobacterium oreochromis TaxID=2906078 RepID=UPI001CE66408|nr:hypothetical protein [Flavobacterium oreochromis]QYS86611.1 hypothetical protein JJC03_00575 [Flavobacterium oreochromis]